MSAKSLGICWLFCLGLPLVLSWGAPAPAHGRAVEGEASSTPLFDRFQIASRTEGRLTVLTAPLLGHDTADVVIVRVYDRESPVATLHSLWETGSPETTEWTLPPSVKFADTAEIGAGHGLVLFEASPSEANPTAGQLLWLDSATEHPRTIATLSTSFEPPRDDEIPHVDVTHDVNDDGLDDLVIPSTDGFLVLVQDSDGSFADAVLIGASPDLSGILGADGYRYDPWAVSRIHRADLNGDGRRDLAFWMPGQLTVHAQHEDGRFDGSGYPLPIEVEIDTDDVFAAAGDDGAATVLHSIVDANGDGVADLVLFDVSSGSADRMSSSIAIHLGTRVTGSLQFAEHPALEIGGDAPTIQASWIGLDQARSPALLVTTVERRFLKKSLWNKLKGAMGDDVLLELELYSLGQGFQPQPGATFRLALDGAPSHREPGWVTRDVLLHGETHVSRRSRADWPRAFNRTWLVGDVTGDGRTDVLIEPEFNELLVFAGVQSPGLFDEHPHRVDAQLHDREFAWLTDLNGDGVMDVVLHSPFVDRDIHGAPKSPPGATATHEITLLLARGSASLSARGSASLLARGSASSRAID